MENNMIKNSSSLATTKFSYDDCENITYERPCLWEDIIFLMTIDEERIERNRKRILGEE